ncbi:hypothetical protein [Bacillus aquiflavi]|nr:hypothetical protein [Bacillus aquiflavi]
MNDKGRIADFYDDYSPYMEIDQLKMEDGFPTSFSNETCPHLYHCSSCSIDKMYLHKE